MAPSLLVSAVAFSWRDCFGQCIPARWTLGVNTVGSAGLVSIFLGVLLPWLTGLNGQL